MTTYDEKTKSVQVGNKSTWDEIADIAQKLAKKEDLTIWRGGEEFGSVEEYAAYAYYLGMLDAMRDVSVYIKLKDNKCYANAFHTSGDLCINADTECVNWGDEDGEFLVPIGIEEHEDFCRITMEYES